MYHAKKGDGIRLHNWQHARAGDLADLDELRTVVSNSFELQLYEPRSTDAWLVTYGLFLKLIGPTA